MDGYAKSAMDDGISKSLCMGRFARGAVRGMLRWRLAVFTRMQKRFVADDGSVKKSGNFPLFFLLYLFSAVRAVSAIGATFSVRTLFAIGAAFSVRAMFGGRCVIFVRARTSLGSGESGGGEQTCDENSKQFFHFRFP